MLIKASVSERQFHASNQYYTPLSILRLQLTSALTDGLLGVKGEHEAAIGAARERGSPPRGRLTNAACA